MAVVIKVPCHFVFTKKMAIFLKNRLIAIVI